MKSAEAPASRPPSEPGLGPWDLAPYGRGLVTLSTFVDGFDEFNLWAEPTTVLLESIAMFGRVLMRLIEMREAGRQLPVRCHAVAGDLAALDRLEPLVAAWHSERGEPPAELCALAKGVLDAVMGSYVRRDGGEPALNFSSGSCRT